MPERSFQHWIWVRGMRGVAWGALLLALITGRVVWSARTEWEAAQAALAEQDSTAAMMHLRRAAAWHVPFSPYTPRALAALEALGRSQSTARTARSATAAARSPLSGAMASDPDTGLTLLALLGWLLWTGGALRLVSKGLDAHSRPTPEALRALLVIVAGFVLFAAGLAWA